mgnify:CR=1 FL=1
MQTSLSGLRPKERAKVIGFSCEKAVLRRLLELGITKNTYLFCMRWAPLQGAIEVWVRGYRLAIGYEDAKGILIEKEGKQVEKIGLHWQSELRKERPF